MTQYNNPCARLFRRKASASQGVTDLISRMEMASGLSDDSYLLACVKEGRIAIIALSEKNADLAAAIRELEAERDQWRVDCEEFRRERDEALRRRDTWKAKAEGYDEMAAAVRAKVKAEPATMSRLLLKAALIESEAKVARLEGAFRQLKENATGQWVPSSVVGAIVDAALTEGTPE